MAAATFDAISQVKGLAQPQQTRRRELVYLVDFNTLGDGTGLAAGEDAAIGVLPAGYTHERCDAILRTAEGTTATLDIGTEANDDGFMDGGNMNGTPDAHVALAGTEAYVPGTHFAADTELRVKTPSGAATLDDAIIEVRMVGYMADDLTA